MSKKVSMSESESVAWSNLPVELLAIISECLEEGTDDITRFRGVCRSWRSSVTGIPNKLSPLFPQSLSSSCLDPCGQACKSRPNNLIANVIYLARRIPLKNDASDAFMFSLQESKAGKLLLRHPITYHPIIGTSGDSLDFLGWSLTRVAISHNFHFSPRRCLCGDCTLLSRTKVVFIPNTDDFPTLRVGDSEAMALFQDYDGMYAIRHCLSNTHTQSHTQLVTGGPSFMTYNDLVNFNGCIYAIDNAARVYVLHHTGLQLLRLTSVNLPVCRTTQPGKRFVVSDGDLYLVFNVCVANMNSRHRCYIYKLVMDDINNATSYNLEKVYNLGDRVLFINQDCSFSISAPDLHLPPPFVGNRIFVAASAFHSCHCFQKGYRVYHVGGKPARIESAYSALFQPPPLWINQLQRVVSPKKKEKKKKKRLQFPPGEEIANNSMENKATNKPRSSLCSHFNLN